jgi:hypothetical protein
LRLEGHVVVWLAIICGFAGSRFAAGCTSATSFHSARSWASLVLMFMVRRVSHRGLSTIPG